MTTVKPGQIWADNDLRSAGRTLRVDVIEDGKAVCTVLTNDNETQAALQHAYGSYGEGDVPVGEFSEDRRGKTTRISAARFKPTRTGYRLIQDEQYGVRFAADLPVFAFPSREDAEGFQAEKGRGVLVVHEYEPDTPNSTEWREV
jgi:hypothetical protein